MKKPTCSRCGRFTAESDIDRHIRDECPARFSDEERLLAKIVAGNNGCWIWTGRRVKGDYGHFWVRGRNVMAHRASYEMFVGPIPDGLQLDHLCRNRPCVRPDHLEPVTCRENLLRGETLNARNAAKTHCPKGHPYTRGYKGYRVCRECKAETSRQSYQRKKARKEMVA